LNLTSASKDLCDRPCFVCVISSHGKEQPETNTHGITAIKHMIEGSDEKYVATQTLIDMFDDSKCPGLAGKPKLFFIQVSI